MPILATIITIMEAADLEIETAFDGNKVAVAEAELNAELAGKAVDMQGKGKKTAAKAGKKAAAPAAAPAKK